MDTGSVVVVLGVLLLVLGLSLMRRGSSGAEAESPDDPEETLPGPDNQ